MTYKIKIYHCLILLCSGLFVSCNKIFEEPPNLNPSGRTFTPSGLEYGYGGAGVQFSQVEVSCQLQDTSLTAGGKYQLRASDGTNSIFIDLVTDTCLTEKTYTLSGKNGSVELYTNSHTEIGVLESNQFTLTVTSCLGNQVSGYFSGLLYNITYGGQEQINGSFDRVSIDFVY